MCTSAELIILIVGLLAFGGLSRLQNSLRTLLMFCVVAVAISASWLALYQMFPNCT